MTTHDSSWPAGTPCWVDITVSDLARSQAFYRTVLGWEFTESEPEAFGGYCNALLGGRQAAGMSPPMGEDSPHFWTVYLATDDAAASDAAITQAGGRQILAPMQVGSFGTMGIYADPTGAVFGTWASDEHTGFGVADEPGAVTWCEGMVGDYEVGKAFYASAFGFTYTDISDENMSYAMFSVPAGERPAGGIGGITDQPPYWSVTFEVDGTDAAVQRVRDAGGAGTVEPFVF